MTAVSIALVAMVLTILIGFVDGMRRTITSAASRNNYVVCLRGVIGEAGYVDHQTIDIMRTRPEIAVDAKGTPLLSPEILVGFDPTPDAAQASTATIRAVMPVAYEVHRGIKLLAGRRPERDKNEWMVGQRLAVRFPNLGLGSKFHFGPLKTEFQIVGVFADDGSARESEVWADLNDIATLIHVPPADLNATVVHVVLKPGYGEQFANALRSDNRFKVDSMSEEQFYAQAAGFSNQIRELGLIVALTLALGSTFGAMNTMFSAVARRTKEVGTIRVLGFGPLSVLCAFVIESALLGLAGGMIGELLAVATAHLTGLESRLMTVGNILFSFRLPWAAFAYGIAASILIGIAGGVLPAWQASRLNVIEALRE